MSTLCQTALRRPKSKWGVLDYSIFNLCTIIQQIKKSIKYTLTAYYLVTILYSFQGVCQDHQAPLHSSIQPLHPERGCAQRHSQHQQCGGGAATRAWHRWWRTQPAEQTAGCLTEHSSVVATLTVCQHLLCHPPALLQRCCSCVVLSPYNKCASVVPKCSVVSTAWFT